MAEREPAVLGTWQQLLLKGKRSVDENLLFFSCHSVLGENATLDEQIALQVPAINSYFRGLVTHSS